MKQSQMYFGFVGIIILAIIAFFVINQKEVVKVENPLPGNATTTPSEPGETGGGVVPAKPPIKTPPSPAVSVIPANYKTYTSETHDFSLGYPKTLTLNNGFSSFHRLNTEWRTGTPSNIQGTPLFQIDLYKVDHASPAGSPYPLFYTAAVRAAVSNNVKECYSTDGGNSQLIGTENIGGVQWKVFTSGDAGMMQYVKSKNYRTIRGTTCYVLQQVATGSSYKDETMKPGMSEAQLDAIFASGFDIIKTFRFR